MPAVSSSMSMNANPAQLKLLYEISSVVSSARTLDDILSTLVHLAVSVMGCDACLVYLRDRASNALVLRASQLDHRSEIGHLRLGAGEGITGWVLEHESVVALPQRAYNDERFKRFPMLVEDTYEAFLSAPLIAAGEAIGVINIHHRDPHPHTPEEVAVMMFLGEQMAGAIVRARLQEEKLEIAAELETRKLIERAKGILQRTYALSEEAAYLKLRNESRRSRRSMRALAEAIIMTDSLARAEARPE